MLNNFHVFIISWHWAAKQLPVFGCYLPPLDANNCGMMEAAIDVPAL
jgi:hypothetical protein